MLDWNDATTWRVLVVDDEPDNLEVIAETLEFCDAQVKTANNGAVGIEVYNTFQPNLILVDLSMPVMDGWRMRASLKADSTFNGTPIIALTAHAMGGDRERALAAGFDGYLTKPVNVLSIVDDIRAAVAKPVIVPEAEQGA
jgi:CheY-like chemotaxis protein